VEVEFVPRMTEEADVPALVIDKVWEMVLLPDEDDFAVVEVDVGVALVVVALLLAERQLLSVQQDFY
jgi:hypothetical protein